MEKRNYNQDLKINHHDLENEWIEQPSLYMYYAEMYSDAVLERDEAKNDLDVAYAELEFKLRNEWEKHLPKYPSDAVVQSWVIQQEKHKKALAKYHKATHNVNLMQSAKTAFDHRRKALENMVSLYITGYHSEPKVNKQITKEKHLGLKKGTVLRRK